MVADSEARSRFSSDFLSYEGLIRSVPNDFQLVYWTRRVKTLEELVANPPPGNKFLSWVERRSSERTALTVAIVGLFFAAFFGLLGVVVGVIQLLVSYWAWKYPVQAGS